MVYAWIMTLSARNNLFRGGIIFAAVSFCLVAAGGYFSHLAFPDVAEAAGLRSQGIAQMIAVKLSDTSIYVPFWTMLGMVAYSLISMIIIYYFFENTQSPEILFFAVFVISLSFEFIRILLPFKMIFTFPVVYLINAFRALIFGRCLGLFSIFAAGVYAAGLDAQKQKNIFMVLVLAALFIALNVPVDSLVWDSTLALWNGYNAMLRMVETGILVITIATFFISAYTRSSKNYTTVGIGASFVLAGRSLLFSSDNWITFPLGLVFLVIGTFFFCTRLHREYLWL